MFIFRKIWRALFSWNTCLEILSFSLLPTNSNWQAGGESHRLIWDSIIKLWSNLSFAYTLTHWILAFSNVCRLEILLSTSQLSSISREYHFLFKKLSSGMFRSQLNYQFLSPTTLRNWTINIYVTRLSIFYISV